MNKTLLAAIAAALALGSAHPALAQKAVSEEDATALALYALPTVFDGMRQSCVSHLPADAYVLQNADFLSARFEAASVGTFQQARRALFAMGGEGEGAMPVELMQGMGEAELGPFIDGFIRQMVMSEMDADSCNQADHILEHLDPLPPENLAGLLGFIIAEEAASED